MIYAETERLILRSWKPEDLSLFADMNKDNRVMRYFLATLSEGETEAFFNRIQDEFNRKGWGLYAVELKSTGDFIGYVVLHEIGFDAGFTPGIEIGWRLAADYHNQGYATEAAKAVLKLAKGLRIDCLYSFTAKNQYSVGAGDAENRDDKSRRVRPSEVINGFTLADPCALYD